MNYVFHRGEYVNENQAYLTRDNRAFRFGDGFFESIRIFNGKPLFFDTHWARITDSAQALKILWPENLTRDKLYNQVMGLISRNNVTAGGRVRITFFRKSLGFYQPRDNDCGYYMESDAFVVNEFELNPVGKMLDIYPEFKKDINRLSIYKTLNSQLPVMASIYAQEKGLDDVLIQNQKNAVIEATASNLFIVSNSVLYTPSLSEGCIAGTMRMNVINLAIDSKIKVYECTLNPQNLHGADEVFLTNAIRGIEWVVAYRTKRYYNEMAKKLLAAINEAATKDTSLNH
ncbi:MAG: aminotransferase class IV [Flavobacteriales bacterium]|nr:aminotransferase class IV [Flavobacteriales bacterium]